jgi:hypothetical protein
VITSSPEDFASDNSEKNYQVFTADGTLFRIAARVNPTIYLLKQGTIIHKWPFAKMNEVKKTIDQLKR